ncbi:drug:proton antiporter [Massilia phosphatilytica]|nr:drug:proton antiporter [Massilia phosphatilytica]
MTTMLRIAVLVSTARHPVSGQPVRSSSDAAAFELGCGLAPPGRLTVLSAGMTGKEHLEDYLGLGVEAIEVLTVAATADVLPALLARVKGFDLVLCGMRSDGQSASGMLPYLLAEGLGVPLVGDVLEATANHRTLTVRQFLPKGMRRRLEVSLPAVLAVHPRAPQTRQYAYARARAGRVTYVAGAIGGGAAAPAWQFEPATRRPRPLKAKVVQSGHSRMMGAIGGDAGARGGQVVKQGSAEQKAQILLDYLREHRLVDF